MAYWKEAIWSLTKNKKQQGDKKDIDLRKLRVNKITGRQNHKAALNEKPTDSPQWFFIRGSI